MWSDVLLSVIELAVTMWTRFRTASGRVMLSDVDEKMFALEYSATKDGVRTNEIDHLSLTQIRNAYRSTSSEDCFLEQRQHEVFLSVELHIQQQIKFKNENLFHILQINQSIKCRNGVIL